VVLLGVVITSRLLSLVKLVIEGLKYHVSSKSGNSELEAWHGSAEGGLNTNKKRDVNKLHIGNNKKYTIQETHRRIKQYKRKMGKAKEAIRLGSHQRQRTIRTLKMGWLRQRSCQALLKIMVWTLSWVQRRTTAREKKKRERKFFFCLALFAFVCSVCVRCEVRGQPHKGKKKSTNKKKDFLLLRFGGCLCRRACSSYPFDARASLPFILNATERGVSSPGVQAALAGNPTTKARRGPSPKCNCPTKQK
jgi:hypothetical protein